MYVGSLEEVSTQVEVSVQVQLETLCAGALKQTVGDWGKFKIICRDLGCHQNCQELDPTVIKPNLRMEPRRALTSPTGAGGDARDSGDRYLWCYD